MEHWFDRATKFFAGGTISRRGVLEGAALAGTSALIAGSPALAWGESELAQHRRRRRIPGNRGAGGPCTRQDKGGTSTMTFSAHGTYKGQALTLQGTHTTRNHKHPSGKTHMRVDLAGNLLLDITHSSTQSGTSPSASQTAWDDIGNGFFGMGTAIGTIPFAGPGVFSSSVNGGGPAGPGAYSLTIKDTFSAGGSAS